VSQIVLVVYVVNSLIDSHIWSTLLAIEIDDILKLDLTPCQNVTVTAQLQNKCSADSRTVQLHR
jgi:hypothetical protein